LLLESFLVLYLPLPVIAKLFNQKTGWSVKEKSQSWIMDLAREIASFLAKTNTRKVIARNEANALKQECIKRSSVLTINTND
jgi:hypothetical protein